MEKGFKFAPTVMLIDACYLNTAGSYIRQSFSPIVNRELPQADLPAMLEYMALDGGVQVGDNQVHVIFIYEPGQGELSFCKPSSLEKELHGVAFKGTLGEFTLYTFEAPEPASREQLFMEAVQLLGETKETNRLILVPDEMSYGKQVYKLVSKIKGKDEVTVLGMDPSQKGDGCRFEMVGFPVLQALGIRADELD